jgi:hypothetical protein
MTQEKGQRGKENMRSAVTESGSGSFNRNKRETMCPAARSDLNDKQKHSKFQL